MGRPLKDLTGRKFGRLTVLSRGEGGAGRSYWICQCECGITKSIAASTLKSGNTRSCGCLNKELSGKRAKDQLTTHGLSGTPLYVVWQSMIRRCYDDKTQAYPLYGGRGIAVCKEWHESAAFLQWALDSGYKRGLSIERINNDGDYSPSNCRWATMLEQGKNRRNTIYVEYKGRKVALTELLHEKGVKKDTTVRQRLRHGWDIESAINTPIQGTNKCP